MPEIYLFVYNLYKSQILLAASGRAPILNLNPLSLMAALFLLAKPDSPFPIIRLPFVSNHRPGRNSSRERRHDGPTRPAKHRVPRRYSQVVLQPGQADRHHVARGCFDLHLDPGHGRLTPLLVLPHVIVALRSLAGRCRCSRVVIPVFSLPERQPALHLSPRAPLRAHLSCPGCSCSTWKSPNNPTLIATKICTVFVQFLKILFL